MKEEMIMQEWSLRYTENIRDYKGYAIGKLLGLINDPEIISLAGGLPSPKMFLQAELKKSSQKHLDVNIEHIMQYSNIRGEAELIDAVITFLSRDDIRVTAENVMVTTSAQQGLDQIARLFLEPGDTVVVERPTFGGALAAFQMQCPTYLGVDLKPDGMDVQYLKSVLSDWQTPARMPKLIYVVPDYQNPSGVCMSLAKREALLDLSEQFSIPIIEDSPYRTLRYSGDLLPSLFTLDQHRGGGRVIGVYTFSKMFCPGMRVGFNIGPPEVIEKMTNIKEGSALCTPKYNQDICTDFLKETDLDAYFARCCAYYSDKMEAFLEAMETHFPPKRGVTWTHPEGGMFLWVSVPESIDTRKLFYEALKFKVAFVPGEAFYGERAESHHMRVNFSFCSKKQLQEAVKRLSDCLGQHGV
jgi:2-aminoadipate transaminase